MVFTEGVYLRRFLVTMQMMSTIPLKTKRLRMTEVAIQVRRTMYTSPPFLLQLLVI